MTCGLQSKHMKKRSRKKAEEAAKETVTSTKPAPAPVATPVGTVKDKRTKVSTPSPAVSVADPNSALPHSSFSLHQPKAQSARSYLAERGLDGSEKQKKRATEAQNGDAERRPTKEGFKKSITSLFKGKDKNKEKKAVEDPKASGKATNKTLMPFSVRKKVRNLMANLFSPGEAKSMRWSDFVKVCITPAG